MMKKIIIFSGLFFLIPSALSYSCADSVPYCKNMQSCEQAQFYLKQCGVTRLDRDNDGIPCENVCGKGKKKSKSKATTKKAKKSKSKKK